jgi:hypothetical protein
MADDVSLSTVLEVENDNVNDEAASDDTVIPEPYDITSYGADYDVEGIVRRLRRGEIFMPSFQREYVWNQTEASRIIESLLLGLPVPGVFIATDLITRRFLVIDGQQRLKTLLFFYTGSLILASMNKRIESSSFMACSHNLREKLTKP